MSKVLSLKNLITKKHFTLMGFALLALAFCASTAMAYTDPASGDLFYEAYELVIDKILGGPIGFVIAAFMLLGGIILLVQGRGLLLPMVCIVGAAMIIKAKDIVGSFGYTLDAYAVSTQPVVEQMTRLIM